MKLTENLTEQCIVIDFASIKNMSAIPGGDVFCATVEGLDRSNENWNSHFKHLILAMPGLVEAANNMCNKLNGLNTDPVLDEFNALCDALEPYKDII